MLSFEEAKTIDGFNQAMIPLVYDAPFRTAKKNVVEYEFYHLTLGPMQRQKVQVRLVSKTVEVVDEYFEIMVQDGMSQFFNLTANIESPKI